MHDISSWIWIFIPLAPFGVGLIAILVRHQQRMAEIVHGVAQGNSEEVAALREEVRQLKAQMGSMSLALESLSASKKESSVQDRIGEVRS